jgi:hypothetical protein
VHHRRTFAPVAAILGETLVDPATVAEAAAETARLPL